MAPKRDLYEILQVKKNASQDEIKKSYRTLARKHHPDVNPGNPKAEQTFKEISAAYDVLGDPEKRKMYDEFGEDALRQGFDPEQARAYQQWTRGRQATGGGRFGRGDEDLFSRFRTSQTGAGDFDFDDLLGDLLKGRGGARAARGRPAGTPGSDVEAQIEIDLLEAIHGAERAFTVQGAPGTEARTVRVRIPPGVKDGDRVRVPGQGGPGLMGGAAGDLYLRVQVRPHPRLKRDGDDLELSVPVTVGEAARGARIQVPTPDGPVSLTIPAGTQSGTRMRLKARGVPHRGGGGRGDLYVNLLIHLPEGDAEQARAAIDALEAMYQKDVRADLRL